MQGEYTKKLVYSINAKELHAMLTCIYFHQEENTWNSAAVFKVVSFRSPALRWKEVSFQGGKAGASSEYTGYFAPQYGFMNEPNRNWASKEKPTLPEIIWYDFGARRVKASKIAFQTRDKNEDAARKQVPRHFKFVGSNSAKCDADAEWTTICEKKVLKPLESVDDVRGCSSVQENTSRAYRCLGLIILDMEGELYTSIRNIRIWKKT